jgi:hypothetical protein
VLLRLVGGVLGLRRFQHDFNGFLLFVDIDVLAIGLIALGDHLNENLALRNCGQSDLAFLTGPHLPLRFGSSAEFDYRVAAHKPDNDGGVGHRFIVGVSYMHSDLGHGRCGKGERDENSEENQDGTHISLV